MDVNRHSQAGISINGTVESSILADSVQLSPQLQKVTEHAGGGVFPSFAAGITAAPTIQFTTKNISLLETPINIASVVVSTRAYNEVGGHGEGYISFTVTKGIIVPVKLSASKGQQAKLQVQIYAVSSDGDTEPVQVGTTAHTLGMHPASYTAGEVNLGSDLAGVQNIDFNFGYEIDTNEGESGKSFATHAYWKKQVPTVSTTVQALSEATEQRINTGQKTTGSISVSFRKLTEGGVVTDTGKVTITMTRAFIEAQSVQSGSPYSVNLLITPILSAADADLLTFS